jgi:glycosyltransferase involved in cell wall biosynthesis
MRVLLVSGPAVGGIRAHLWQLLELLPPLDVEPLLAAPESVAAPPGTQRVDLPIGERLQPLRDLKQVSALTAIRKSWRADLIHAHGYKAAMLASVAGTKPLILTFHNLWPADAGPLARAGLRWALRESIRQVAVSQAVLDSVGGCSARSMVIPNAIDWRACAALPPRAAAREALGVDGEAFVVGFAGRLTPVKGAQVLLAAAHELISSLPNLVVLMAGEGPDRDELARQASPLGERVRWLGPVPEIRLLFAAADAWCVPSLAEGGGIIALEGMAAGLPLIASGVGGLLEIIEPDRSGLLVPPDDPTALAEGVRCLAADPALRIRLGTQAAEAARQRPGPEESARRLVELYGKAVGERRAG